MSPFFVKPSNKSAQNQDVFQNFPQLLTEMVLRIPYQVNINIFLVVLFSIIFSFKKSQ